MKEELESTGSEESFCEHGNESTVSVPSNAIITNFDRQTTLSWK
jgi:hypothetical protein